MLALFLTCQEFRLTFADDRASRNIPDDYREVLSTLLQDEQIQKHEETPEQVKKILSYFGLSKDEVNLSRTAADMYEYRWYL